jgi:DNA-binding winged helix-turn-helix (wHTH) protein
METPRFFQVFDQDLPSAAEIARPRHFAFGPFHLDLEKHTLSRENDALPLPPKCFDLLCILVRSNGELLEKDRLMQQLWPDTYVEEANLSNLVALLRKALGDSPSNSQYVQTVPKLGYRFKADVADERKATYLVAADIAAQPVLRIIVFPFRIRPDLHDLEHLSYSLPDSISSSLAELNAFVVRSMQVAMRFDAVRWEPRQVAEQADVDYIITGAILGDAPRLHASVQLMRAESGTLLWSKSWSIESSEIISLHGAVVQLTVNSLVRPDPAQPGVPRPAESSDQSEAFNAYLLANHLSLNRTPESMRLARDLYISCVERDPSFGPAWARLGRCYHFLEKLGSQEERNSDLAPHAFQRAFAISPDLVLAHSLYTPVEADLGNAQNAMVRLLRTLQMHSNSPELLAGLVHACRYCGQLDASLAAHQRAIELDRNTRTSVAHSYFAKGDYERALFWYGTGPGLYLDALALTCMGRQKEAQALLWSRREQFHLMSGAMRSLDAFLRDDRQSGVAALEAALQNDNPEPELQFYMARQASHLTATGLANEFLRRSVDAGYWSSDCMMRDPWFAAVRATPEFRRVFETAKRHEADAYAAFLVAQGDRILS